MDRDRIRVMVEVGLSVALAAVLNLFKVRLPINIAGGTVSLNMLPIFVLALRRGWGPGMLAGALYGFVDLLFDPYVIHPVQFVLDYPVAYAMAGLAGLGSGVWRRSVERSGAAAAAVWAIPWLVLGALGRLVAHWLSGIVFFGSNAPAGQPVWLYSLVYNASYVLPSLAFAAAAALLLLPALELAVPVQPYVRAAS